MHWHLLNVKLCRGLPPGVAHNDHTIGIDHNRLTETEFVDTLYDRIYGKIFLGGGIGEGALGTRTKWGNWGQAQSELTANQPKEFISVPFVFLQFGTIQNAFRARIPIMGSR